jgi:hypothetical protein
VYAYLAYVREARAIADAAQANLAHAHGHAVPLTHNHSIASLGSGDGISMASVNPVSYVALPGATTEDSAYSVVHQALRNGSGLWVYVLLSGLGFAVQVNSFAAALDAKATLSQATLLSNLTAVFVLLYNVGGFAYSPTFKAHLCDRRWYRKRNALR